MQATYSVPRSPLTAVVVVAAVLIAILVGGVGGYVVKGALGASGEQHRSVAGGIGASSPVGSHSSVYVQGGRPAIVYAPEPPSIYVQGGRPQVVYDDVAQLARR